MMFMFSTRMRATDIVQRGHLWLGHELCDEHDKHVSWGDIVQRGHLWLGYQLCDYHEQHVLWGDSVFGLVYPFGWRY